MTQQAEREYTWQDLEAAVGRDFSGGVTQTGLPLERGDIREFCEVLEMDCPLFHDDEAARQNGYRGIIVPASMISATAMRVPVWKPGDPTRWSVAARNATAARPPQAGGVPVPAPRTTQGFGTDLEMEYHAPVYAGDVLTTRGNKLVSVAVRETSIGSGAFTTFQTETVNQRGELVAVQRLGTYRFNPHPGGARQRGESLAATPPRASAWQAPPARASYVDWSKQRLFEEVKEGDEVPPVTFNMTVQRLVMEAGANRDFNPIHHNTELAKAQNAPEMYANTWFIRGMWERTVREYIGVGGKIKRLGPFRMRIFNTAGEAVVVRGTVKRKWQEGAEHLVELEVWSEHSQGVSVGPGPVVVILPSKR